MRQLKAVPASDRTTGAFDLPGSGGAPVRLRIGVSSFWQTVGVMYDIMGLVLIMVLI